MTTTKQARATKQATEQAPEVTPEQAPESPRDTLAREANEHAAWLTSVRTRVLEYGPNHGICSGGMFAFLKDVGIPVNESSRRESRQPAIPPEPSGVKVEWLTDDGVAGMLADAQAKRSAQRAKIARGITRAHDLGYLSADSVAEHFAALGLDGLPKQVNGSISLGTFTFRGLPDGTTSEQIREAFHRVLSAAVGTYLPGWQHPEVTGGVDVYTSTAYVGSEDASDHWSF